VHAAGNYLDQIGGRTDGPRADAEHDRGSQYEEDAMKTIVIATDGSASAQQAVEFGLELAAEQKAEPIFVHVVPAVDVVPAAGFGVTSAWPHKVTESDRAPLEEAARLASEHGMHTRTELLRGNPADEIVAYSDTVDADLIVMGSRGHGAVLNALLGSVSHGVLHEARRPVLIVRATSVPSEALVT
jgi:nucleotide-binding universal stress UspA family protein